MLPANKRDVLRTLHEALSDGDLAWQHIEHERQMESSSWYGEALSSVLVALEDQSPVYVSKSGSMKDDNGFHVSASVFADSRIIELKAERSGRSARTDWTVNAGSLSALTAVEVRAAADPWSPDIDAEWPNVRTAVAVFAGGRRVLLMPSSRNAAGRVALAEFVATLLRRLD